MTPFVRSNSKRRSDNTHRFFHWLTKPGQWSKEAIGLLTLLVDKTRTMKQRSYWSINFTISIILYGLVDLLCCFSLRLRLTYTTGALEGTLLYAWDPVIDWDTLMVHSGATMIRLWYTNGTVGYANDMSRVHQVCALQIRNFSYNKLTAGFFFVFNLRSHYSYKYFFKMQG